MILPLYSFPLLSTFADTSRFEFLVRPCHGNWKHQRKPQQKQYNLVGTIASNQSIFAHNEAYYNFEDAGGISYFKDYSNQARRKDEYGLRVDPFRLQIRRSWTVNSQRHPGAVRERRSEPLSDPVCFEIEEFSRKTKSTGKKESSASSSS